MLFTRSSITEASFDTDVVAGIGKQFSRCGCAFTPALRLGSGQSGSAYGALIFGTAEAVPLSKTFNSRND
jgi:hypothetical protein